MRLRWLRCVAAVGSLALLLSCGGSSGGTGFLYLVSQGSSPGTVSTYKFGLKTGVLNSSNGVLNTVGKPANTGAQPTNLLFEPRQSFAYTANSGSDDISTFTVNKDGSLTAASATSSVSTSASGAAPNAVRPVALAMDSGAHFLFVANQGDPARAIAGNVSVFSIGSNGALTAVSGSPFPVLVTTPPIPFQPAPALPVSLTVSNQGNFLYVADQANSAVAAFSFDGTTGALTAIPATCPGNAPCFGFLAGTAPSAVFSPPASNFLYVANSGSNDIYAFSIDATKGTLAPVTTVGTTNPVIVPAGVGPVALLSDPSAKYIYALANGGSQVTGYSMNHVTGVLTALSANGGTVSTGANPVAFAIRTNGSSNGDFWLFTANNGGSSISTYTLDFATGGLTPLPQLAAPLAPYGIGVR